MFYFVAFLNAFLGLQKHKSTYNSTEFTCLQSHITLHVNILSEVFKNSLCGKIIEEN